MSFKLKDKRESADIFKIYQYPTSFRSRESADIFKMLGNSVFVFY